jgi:hypothetical protein
MQRLPELGVLAHAVAVAADRDQMTVVNDAIDESGRHHLVAEDLAPLFERLVRGEPGGRVLDSTNLSTRSDQGQGRSGGYTERGWK